VEGTNVNGHPAFPERGPSPCEALAEFLAECHDFEQVPWGEKYFLTANPGGYLRKCVHSRGLITSKSRSSPGRQRSTLRDRGQKLKHNRARIPFCFLLQSGGTALN
jgi:hypothetical protein